MKTKDIILSSIFCVLIIVGAFLKIQLPLIPITLQVFFVLLAASILKFPISIFPPFLYMIMGLIGIPVFTKGGGIWYIFEKSFGYIIGFILAAAVISYLLKIFGKSSYAGLAFANTVGVIIIYLCGIPYFYMIQNIYLAKPLGFMTILTYGLFITLPSDILAIIMVTLIVGYLRKTGKCNV